MLVRSFIGLLVGVVVNTVGMVLGLFVIALLVAVILIASGDQLPDLPVTVVVWSVFLAALSFCSGLVVATAGGMKRRGVLGALSGAASAGIYTLISPSAPPALVAAAGAALVVGGFLGDLVIRRR